MNPIIEYFDWINKNRSRVNYKIYAVYKELVRLMNDKNSEWEYGENKARHAIYFIETFCKHSKGKMGGKSIELELWQLAMIAATFGIVHKIEGTRKFREIFWVVGRKNGKSTIASAVGLYLMIADGEAGAEIYAAATKRDQAKIIWLEAKKMVKKSPVLLKKIKPLVGELVSEFNDSSFKPLGADSETLDGLNVHGALLDEIHAWKTKDLYDVIVDGTTAREEPLTFIVSTAGTIRESIYDIKYDEVEMVINGYCSNGGYKNERMLPLIYELDKREEWITEDGMYKPNPGLGTIKKLDQLQDKVEKAKHNNLLVKNLLCKDFNVRETSSEAWLPFETILNEEMFKLEENLPKYGIGGCDLSATTDLTSAKMIFQFPNEKKIYSLSMYWIPADLLKKRVKEDKVPYDIWRDMGLLRTCEGNTIHPKVVTEWFLELQQEHKIYLWKCGYDAWSAPYWVEEMEETFGENVMVKVIQGKKTLSGPMKKLGRELEAKNIIYNNNPIDKWCLSNTAIDIDKNDNIQPIKTSNSRKRIDGTASLLNSYVIIEDNREEYLYISKRR
jgi:phage terminase large subunit-like protein